ncbi:MAG: cytochrome-c oxidase, cbb3-type subunit II [Alphaproteobacteria bacterium]|nr:cytochrome-c oxidase, cbb3-type subunit II [Alphaproteobacteria bacterium]
MLIKHHALFETNVLLLVLGIFLTIIVGGLVEIVPLFTIESTIEKVQGMRPYSPLELVGRNIYIREGCYVCHSQMIRPFRDEVERYGHYSLAAESQYDHPFQWGSKRNGPDLARVGGKYSDDWHVAHMKNPRSVVPESIMPGYPHLARHELNQPDIAEHLKTLRIVGVPYTDDDIKNAAADLKAQATPDANTKDLMARYPKAHIGGSGVIPGKITELDALIAYLQVVGTMVDFTNFDPKTIER